MPMFAEIVKFLNFFFLRKILSPYKMGMLFQCTYAIKYSEKQNKKSVLIYLCSIDLCISNL